MLDFIEYVGEEAFILHVRQIRVILQIERADHVVDACGRYAVVEVETNANVADGCCAIHFGVYNQPANFCAAIHINVVWPF